MYKPLIQRLNVRTMEPETIKGKVPSRHNVIPMLYKK